MRVRVQNEFAANGRKWGKMEVRSDAAGLGFVRLRQTSVGRDDGLEVVEAEDGVHVLQRRSLEFCSKFDQREF